ncbi:GNAT family N-acetyltransferase [Streptomyces sp. PmtG]
MDLTADDAVDPATKNPQEATELRAALKHLRTEPRGWVFSLKLALCATLTAIGVVAVVQPEWWWRATGVVLIGCMLAHAAELQHETLHNLAYRSRRANTVTGVILGLPMLISFAAYKAAHMRHHRDLGTPMNREFFDYGDQYGTERRSTFRRGVDWAVRFTMVHHYALFVANLGRSLAGREFSGESVRVSRRIRRDHFLALGALLGLGGLSLALGSALVLWVWLIPLVLVAGPVHALIELPEHHGCETLNRDPFANTRTIRSNRLLTWFTNGNNYHVEHHLMPNLPLERLPVLHSEVHDRIQYFHRGYIAYFSTFVRRPGRREEQQVSVDFRVARTEADKADVLRLRDAVYVADQGRLADAGDTAATFDRFDAHAEYIVGYADGQPVGTVKVVPDSAAGLPCDDTVDISELREGHRLVEFGHLMTLPEVRHREIGMALMREAVVHSARKHDMTHILGDFFVDDSEGLRGFYKEIGFFALHEPYEDTRFKGSPLSLVAALDVTEAVRRARTPEGRKSRLLQYFFGDYDTYTREEAGHADTAATPR